MSVTTHRTSPLWLAALLHRLSGLALVIFLPFHFLALGLAIEGEAKLDGFLRWADQPWVKVSEGLLLAALTVHMLGGLRLLAIENLAWREGQTRLTLFAVGFAMAVAFLFLISVF